MDGQLKRRSDGMRRMWLAMLGMSLCLGGTLLAGIVPVSQQSMPPHLFGMLAPLALVAAVLVSILPKRIFVRRLRDLEVETVDELGEATGGFRDAVPVTPVVASPDKTVLEAIERISIMIVRTWMVPVLISMFGFYLGHFGTPIYQWLPFFALSVALQLSLFPSLSKIAKLIERAKRVRCPVPE